MEQTLILFVFMMGIAFTFVAGWLITIAFIAVMAICRGRPVMREIKPLLQEW